MKTSVIPFCLNLVCVSSHRLWFLDVFGPRPAPQSGVQLYAFSESPKGHNSKAHPGGRSVSEIEGNYKYKYINIYIYKLNMISIDIPYPKHMLM